MPGARRSTRRCAGPRAQIRRSAMSSRRSSRSVASAQETSCAIFLPRERPSATDSTRTRRQTSCGCSSTRACSIFSSIDGAGHRSASRRGWPRRCSDSSSSDPGMTPPTIEQVIAAIPDWAGRVVTAERIPAGLTNTNWRVVVDEAPFFVRIPGADTELLAVDRGNEIHNTIAAAEAGVSPRVVQTVPAWDVFALEWLDARTMSNETLRADGMPSRIAATLRQLHAGRRFRDDFDMFRVAERYMALVDERSIRIPAGYREHLGLIPRIEAALRVHRPATVPCHNDLLAENYLDDGERLWLVDWEYSGNNDPLFELGNTAQELGFDDSQIDELCAAYFGETSPALIARMRLQMIMSDVGWTLWAAIQARISTIDYDFTGWAEERWARAEAALDGPDFESWLEAVRPS